jgi:hypothetical protein
MSMMINDQAVIEELLAQRRASGSDLRDEVWDGVYITSPMADNEHQGLINELATALTTVIDWQGLGRTSPSANVSDHRESWTENYRVPDVLVFLNTTTAEDCGTHWFLFTSRANTVAHPPAGYHIIAQRWFTDSNNRTSRQEGLSGSSRVKIDELNSRCTG